MSRYSLHFPIRVPDDVLVELGEFTGKFWSDSLGREPFVIEAIRNYIKPATAAQQPATVSEAGYQWKQVFLPEGTRLRASFERQPYFATVVGGGNQIRRACNIAILLRQPARRRQPQCLESRLAAPSRQ